MPYINLKTTKPLKDGEKAALSREFGKAIECFPGKTERWLRHKKVEPIRF